MEEGKAYIESGILELYVIGDLNPQEKAEVEMMAEKHPEIKAELTQIQNALEDYADAYAVNPAEHLRDRILNSLIPNSDQEQAKIIALAPSNPSSFYKYGFAASLALLLISVAALFVLNTRLEESEQQLAALQASNQTYLTQVNEITQKFIESQEAINTLRNPEVKLIKLKGTNRAPEANMMLAFNPKTQEVMIDMSSFNMPPSRNGQYQLWGIVDGKPVDLGVFDVKSDSTDTGMKKMKSIGGVQAFAVTLEPMGGSTTPTMSEMMVMSPI